VGQTVSSDVLCRGKRSLAVDPKIPAGRNLLLKLISRADILIDPFRPGVLERLGLGPDVFLKEGMNERLIYARLSGFTRTGPYKDMAGHDINYLALSGVLAMLPGTAESPSFQLNLLADFAGGGLTCALGILLALQSRNNTGKGLVVETDMVSGTRYLASFPLIHHLVPHSPVFGNGDGKEHGRGSKLLDGGAPFYGVYTCADGKWMSVGCLELRFYEIFIRKFVESLPQTFVENQGNWIPNVTAHVDESTWPRLRVFLEQGFKTKTRDEWAEVFYGTDSCAVPVLSPAEAAGERGSPVPVRHPSLSQAAPDQNLSRESSGPLKPGQHTEEILKEMKISKDELTQLVASGALGKSSPKL
ncbi:hypothetical protein M0805_009732, partial [Coniferiporia weirii]